MNHFQNSSGKEGGSVHGINDNVQKAKMSDAEQKDEAGLFIFEESR